MLGKLSVNDLQCYFILFSQGKHYMCTYNEDVIFSPKLSSSVSSQEAPAFYIPTEVFPMTTGAWGYLTLASRSSFRVTGEIHVILSPPKILVLCGCFSAIVY